MYRQKAVITTYLPISVDCSTRSPRYLGQSSYKDREEGHMQFNGKMPCTKACAHWRGGKKLEVLCIM